ncbi:hypothetical protein F8M41_008098 [Gigaspora margarita]|uniref:Uncharacterized protein n=1 Tax=Gigaspora margarita TaxID=4874 RepID=A0A8H3WT19_GIGMA|nr:hypothetical protein F8M41_017373 [Gigaspora margarita]KAF0411925.1 hypothetical protein F8M41_008098 [Gigaspora margarita]
MKKVNATSNKQSSEDKNRISISKKESMNKRSPEMRNDMVKMNNRDDVGLVKLSNIERWIKADSDEILIEKMFA